jgi:hypothetical protein
LERPDNWGIPQSQLGVQVRGSGYAADLADSPEQLAAQGVQYVAVSSMDYERFFIRGVRSTPDHPGYVEHQRRFYESLFARGELVWSSAPSPAADAFLNPEIRVYRIAGLKGSGEAGTGRWSGTISRYPPR